MSDYPDRWKLASTHEDAWTEAQRLKEENAALRAQVETLKARERETLAKVERLKAAARVAMDHVHRDATGHPNWYFEDLDRLVAKPVTKENE